MGYTPPYIGVQDFAGITRLIPPNAGGAGTYTRLMPNIIDLYPSLQFAPTTSLTFLLDTGTPVVYYDATSGPFLNVKYSTPDTVLENPLDTKNIYLKTTGTGKLKFGTYTAGIKADSIGYIEVLDSGGTSRRLMVQSA